jgi:hypothetical protein
LSRQIVYLLHREKKDKDRRKEVARGKG